jgi:Spy/CpxP family protein refolding chaperone
MIRRFAFLVALGLAAGSLQAQGVPTPRPDQPHPEPTFEDQLFPPELIMQHQSELALTAEQRAAITDAVKRLQSQVIDVQWQMQYEQQKLAQLLSQSPVDEETALAQIDRVLDLERQVKKAHLATLIRIKNTLTAEQQRQLLALKGHTLAR